MWFRLIADALNDAGYTVNSREVIRLDAPFTEDAVKDYIFRPVMKAMFPDKTSTAELTKQQWCEVVEAVTRGLGERTGVYVPHPSEDND